MRAWLMRGLRSGGLTGAGVWAVAAVAVAVAAGPVAACGGGGGRDSDASSDSPAAEGNPSSESQPDAASSPGADDSEADGASGIDGGSGASIVDDPDDAPLDPLSIRGDVVREHALETGDCFNRLHDLRGSRKVVITARVGCDESHVYEVFHVFDLDVPHPAIHPGDTEMNAYARRQCYDHFEAFVGEAYELSVYEIGVFTPDRVSFEHNVARYRTVHCWLYREGEEPTTFSARGVES